MVGSNPTRETKFSLVQRIERFPSKEDVGGLNPSWETKSLISSNSGSIRLISGRVRVQVSYKQLIKNIKIFLYKFAHVKNML